MTYPGSVSGGVQPSSAFRQDINALRAWAVLAVVGYHFQIAGFAGGFVGVDIFFVISGYLITGQVLSQLRDDRFSLLDFWLSRLRRIFPALFVVTVFAVALGWAFTMPGDYLKHIRQALSALAFASNLTLDGERGYFDAAAQTKPLLHTWSLSIEWQFYLGLPLLLLMAWRLSHASRKLSAARWGLLAFAVASLAWCLWRGSIDPGSTFFSLRARAWELLAGGVIAGFHLQVKNSEAKNTVWLASRWRTALAPLGWLLIAISTVSSLPPAHWPGLLTLLPVSGAVLVVAASNSFRGGYIIGHSVVQRIGDWSYSIYLWHWPLWVFLLERASYGGVSIDLTHKLGLLGLTLILSYLSYRYVEQPFRSRHGFWTARHLAGACALGFMAFTGFTAAVLKTHGFPNRLPDYQQRAELARRTNTPRDECFRDAKSSKQASERFCEFGASASLSKSNVILWGDSLANQYLEPITRAASSIGLHGLIATQSGCRAFLDSPSQNRGVPQSCNQFNQEVLDFVRAAEQPEIVILGRNWGGGELGAKEAVLLVASLLSAGKTVVLILPSLHIGFDVSQRWMENQFRARRAIDEWHLDATPELIQRDVRREIADATAPFSKNPKFITVDPLPKVCEGQICYLVRNGQANFRDTIHISNVNAIQYDDIFAKALTDAWKVSQPKAGQKVIENGDAADQALVNPS